MRLRLRWAVIVTAVVLLASVAVSVARTGRHARAGWRAYHGAWFRVEYPRGFRVRPGMASRTAIPGEDSAFFTSPDRTVEFYVYSPQWYGAPSDIMLNPKTEKLVSSRTKIVPAKPSWPGISADDEQPDVEILWQTIRAKDGSYTRSYVNAAFGPGIMDGRMGQRVFGVKYTSHRAYERYRADYLRFKRSLEQYAD